MQCRYKDFYKAITSSRQTYAEMIYIRSIAHEVFTMRIRKRAINAMDVKRFIVQGGIYSYAHGSKLITQYKENGIHVFENTINSLSEDNNGISSEDENE